MNAKGEVMSNDTVEYAGYFMSMEPDRVFENELNETVRVYIVQPEDADLYPELKAGNEVHISLDVMNKGNDFFIDCEYVKITE